jgi:signal transduction histidine kinase
MSPAEPKPPSSPASKAWYDSLVSGVGTLDALPTGFDIGPVWAHRWIGWRLRGLVLAALLGCLLVVAVTTWLTRSPWVDATWRADDRGHVVLESSSDAHLKALVGKVLGSVSTPDGQRIVVEPAAFMQRAPRWTLNPELRRNSQQWHSGMTQGLAQGGLDLHFADGPTVRVASQPRGLAGLGWAYWPVAALALVIGLVGIVVWLARPDPRNGLYLVLTSAQAVNLLIIAIQTVPGMPLPPLLMALDLPVRLGLDLICAAAVVHIFTLHPQRLLYGPLVAASAWLLAALPGVLALIGLTDGIWWWGQCMVLALGVVALAVLTRSYQLAPVAFTVIMRRLGYAVVLSLALLVAALMSAHQAPATQQRVAEVGSAVWTVFFSSVLLLVPFLTRSRQLLREFALLAGISTVATSLDLLFVALFSLGQVASVALAVFLSLGAYALARDRIVNQLTGNQALTIDRIFEQLYRVGRAIEQEPESRQQRMEAFLRELFEPLEMTLVTRGLARSRAVAEGAALMVPAPHDGHTDFEGGAGAMAHAWVLKHAHKGKRLFTAEDARLADRVLQYLRRAVVYDRAVERGRTQERQRIAQDLHDDIGARLLTLMYKAQTPELEEYLRHTLQDLKTLTRGLAASEHLLSHAIAEWKSDIGMRAAAAHINLHWNFSLDRDLPLTVTQWSGLTRILRELVNNVIAHAQASRLQIEGSVLEGRLLLWLADDGVGRDPTQWSHGLGLGGVRKRVRSLGGAVRWRENQPRGIICEVQIDHLDKAPPVPAPPSIRRDGERETRY